MAVRAWVHKLKLWTSANTYDSILERIKEGEVRRGKLGNRNPGRIVRGMSKQEEGLGDCMLCWGGPGI